MEKEALKRGFQDITGWLLVLRRDFPNCAEAARNIGMSRETLRRKMLRYGVPLWKTNPTRVKKISNLRYRAPCGKTLQEAPIRWRGEFVKSNFLAYTPCEKCSIKKYEYYHKCLIFASRHGWEGWAFVRKEEA